MGTKIRPWSAQVGQKNPNLVPHLFLLWRFWSHLAPLRRPRSTQGLSCIVFILIRVVLGPIFGVIVATSYEFRMVNDLRRVVLYAQHGIIHLTFHTSRRARTVATSHRRQNVHPDVFLFTLHCGQSQRPFTFDFGRTIVSEATPQSTHAGCWHS